MVISLVFSLFLSILAVIFALQNPAMVTIQFLSWEFNASLSQSLLFTLALGVLIGVLAVLPAVVRSKIHVMGHRIKISALEKEIGQFKPNLNPQPERMAKAEEIPAKPAS